MKNAHHKPLFCTLLTSIVIAINLSVVQASSPGMAPAATYWELLISHGKEINLVLAVMAFFALFLFSHLILLTKRKLTSPQDLRQALMDDIASGDIEQACNRAQNNRSLLAKTILPALRLHDHPWQRLEQVCEGAGRRAVSSLRQEATYLANIGVLCPMLGLLGTVLGMITAFESFSAELDVSAKQAMLTAAIGKAMITTAAGLIVGIPSMAAYYFATGRINRIADELELTTENLLASLKETK